MMDSLHEVLTDVCICLSVIVADLSAALRNLLQPREPTDEEGEEPGSGKAASGAFTLSASGVNQLVSELLPARASGLLATLPPELLKEVLKALAGLMGEGASRALDEDSEVRPPLTLRGESPTGDLARSTHIPVIFDVIDPPYVNCYQIWNTLIHVET